MFFLKKNNFFKLSKYKIFQELDRFFKDLWLYLKSRFYTHFSKFEKVKDVFVDLLYKKRGLYARSVLHFFVIFMSFVVLILGPRIIEVKQDTETYASESKPVIAVGGIETGDFYTAQAEDVKKYRGGEIIEHVVEAGETIESIALKYNLQPSTIIWENNLSKDSKLKEGQVLRILPVDGVKHIVKRGETLKTICKKYKVEGPKCQATVDYPFNEFLDDENFTLVPGQTLLVVNGQKIEKKAVIKDLKTYYATNIVEQNIVSSGRFMTPTAGVITQRYTRFHKAVDIANGIGTPIYASDGGVIEAAGWNSGGYGYFIKIRHKDGYETLYAHLSQIKVSVGQSVDKGQLIGLMGSTGRSTGPHLHFEIRRNGAYLNPFKYIPLR